MKTIKELILNIENCNSAEVSSKGWQTELEILKDVLKLIDELKLKEWPCHECDNGKLLEELKSRITG